MTHSLPYQHYLLVEAAIEAGDIPKARKLIAKVLPAELVEELLDKIRAAYAPNAAWRGGVAAPVVAPKPRRAKRKVDPDAV